MNTAARSTADGGAWELLARFGPEYGRGFSNHAPMAAEALEYIGRAELVEEWVAANVAHLEPHPPRGEAALVLGDGNHTGWAEHFAAELATSGPEVAVAEAAELLADGLAGAAGHGVLRTWHALRGWRRHRSDVRLDELARGLGYWASTYLTAPAAPAAGDLDPLELLALVPPAPSRPGTITERVAALDLDTIAQLCAAARLDSHPDAAAAQVCAAAAQVLRRGPGTTGLLHAVTVADAVGNLAAVLPCDVGARLVTQAWGLTVALYALYGRPATPCCGEDPASWDALVAAALDSGDPHHIKLVAAAISADGSVDTTVLRAALTEVLGPLPR